MRRVGIESPPKVLAEIGPVRVRKDRPFGGGPVQKGTSAMLGRHLCLVRAGLAAGLLSSVILMVGGAARGQAPGAKDSEPSSAPAGLATETVDLLGGRNAGDLDVVARGHGQDRVKLSIHNRSNHRLNVVIPPGLVASSAVGQPGGGGGAGGRLQSIGLGSVSNREGAFGEFRTASTSGGLLSVGTANEAISNQVAVPVGETVDLTIPGVCLNYGLPSPTPRNTFRLVDVSEYTTNARVRKALRSLATYGTSHGVAQAVMWHVCNDLPFELMAEQTGKVMNFHEIALAARFVEALGAPSDSELIDPAALSHSRIYVQVRGQGPLAADAKRLAGQLEGLYILGLPIQVAESPELTTAAAPALFLNVMLTDSKVGETRGVIVASSCTQGQAWVPLGKLAFRDNSSVSVLDGTTLSKVVDRTVASNFVTVKPARRTLGSTTLKVENRLPFTISNLVVKAGTSSGSPSVPFSGVGVGPARSALLPIQAATASLVEHVELNGL
jgi:hypothetical protein